MTPLGSPAEFHPRSESRAGSTRPDAGCSTGHSAAPPGCSRASGPSTFGPDLRRPSRATSQAGRAPRPTPGADRRTDRALDRGESGRAAASCPAGPRTAWNSIAPGLLHWMSDWA